MSESPKISNETNSSVFRSVKRSIPFVALFLFAAAVQLIVWQNNQAQVENSLSGVTAGYKSDARTLLAGDFSTFLFGTDPPSNANVLGHPPGYPILIAAVYSIFGESGSLRLVQILLNALAPLIVWLIAKELFESVTAWLAAFLTALSPQIAYNSVLILPDSIAMLPLLIVIYFLIKTYKKERVEYAILCGLFLGVSCWFRANGLLIPIFAAAFFLVFLSKRIRIRAVGMLLLAFVAVILPITIRNYVGFHAFIPISLGAGINLIEGIGDFDKEGRFGLPPTDAEVMELESVVLDCPDCKNSLYSHGGVERERWRTSQAVAVITSNPFWFAGVAVRRGLGFFRFERVPAIAASDESANLPGGTAYYLNVPLRLIQKLFITAVFLPLFVVGIILLLRNREDRKKLLILLIIPIYYVCFQSPLHTEYRYVLAIQPFMLLIAAVALVRFWEFAAARLNARRLARSE